VNLVAALSKSIEHFPSLRVLNQPPQSASSAEKIER